MSTSTLLYEALELKYKAQIAEAKATSEAQSKAALEVKAKADATAKEQTEAELVNAEYEDDKYDAQRNA